MPVDRRTFFQLSLLVLAVPTQFLISKYWISTQSQRNYAIKDIVKTAAGFSDKYLSWQSWKTWCEGLISGQSDASSSSRGQGESPAVDVIKQKEPEGYFASSPTPRSPRPSHVKFRVGQVIRHKRWGYRGIIIGWDETAKAPESWLQQNHPPGKGHWRQHPNYSVLVDTRDRMQPQTTYVAEENMDVVSDTKVIHPEIDDYFENYDGAQYIPRPWLREVYPRD
ncbi:uncharacterized protein LOC135487980 [Lineus longissimus]|uniref:uncharacterized protein LOC135487980 n=1 Tax=Lineus longissimus TaxID=88925 RepID=UPI002B4C66B4